MKKNLLCMLSVLFLILCAVFPVNDAKANTNSNNTSVVYSPGAGSSFNPEGGRAAGTTYAKNIVLKHSGANNDLQLVTYDQLVLKNGKQVYPIYRSNDAGNTWKHVTDIVPSDRFPDFTRTAQPFLYELPQDVGQLKKGTLLFAGMIMPEDRSRSRLVLYKSENLGNNWDFVSIIDEGGPAVYDPSPNSTTSTVWEPSIIVDGKGGLAVYYSDERQKAKGVLQAVSYRRSVDSGKTWGPLVNVSAPTNRSDRPGMITVTKLPNGKYLATFEVVNRPNQKLNTAPVYFKVSPDGLNWSPETSIGKQVQLKDGRGIGSSPYVKWVPTGGPNGAIVIASKWSLNTKGEIERGQNLFVNYHLGEGYWERFPMPVTYDSTDTEGGTFSGFAQSIDYSADGRTIFQATNVDNNATKYNDIVVGRLPLSGYLYEAEKAERSTSSRLVSDYDAINGQKIGDLNTQNDYLKFKVKVPTTGSYDLYIRYDNGSKAKAEHTLQVNDKQTGVIKYEKTRSWGRFGWVATKVMLQAGDNTIKLSVKNGFAEVDTIILNHASSTFPQFKLLNAKSSKYAEVVSARLDDGASVGQWGNTDNSCQIWTLIPQKEGSYLENANSRKLLEIPNASTKVGTKAVQWGNTGHKTQKWEFVLQKDTWQIRNLNSGMFLSVTDKSLKDGALLEQIDNTDLSANWHFIREGIQ